MNRFWRHRAVFPVLSVLVPLWVVFGRIPFGAIGWLTIFLFFIAPIVMIVLLALTLTYSFQKDVRQRGSLLPSDVKPLAVLMGSLMAFSLFMIDFGDTDDSVVSVFANLTVRNDTTIAISGVLAVACLATSLGALAWAIVHLVQRRHSFLVHETTKK